MKKTVKNFYSTFDFEKIVTNPPRLIQEFLDKEIEFISIHLKQNKTILEVGCGYGRLLNTLADKADKVIGIDFSEPLLRRAKEYLKNKVNAELKLMDAQKMSFDDESFDYVLCLDATFGNMPNIEGRVLSEMKRLVRGKGEVIVSVFSEKAKDSQIENYQRIGLTGLKDDGNAVSSDEGFYSRRFTKEQLYDLFTSTGLSCEIMSLCPINYVVIGKKI